MSHLIEYLTGLLIVYVEKNQRKQDPKKIYQPGHLEK